ncbi:MAG: 3-keto-disaccharide hydrolase [Planctomycetota bacterium]|jgi:hypothetical protein
MNHPALSLGLACVALLCGHPTFAADDAVEPGEKIVLFDGKSLDGWVGVSRDPQADVGQTWTVGPGGVLACAGKPVGYLRTEKAYKNYKLHLEFRWAGRPGNNGILVHMVGDDVVWPKSLECQGAYQSQGDYFEIGGFEFHEHAAGGHRVRGRRVLKYGEHNEREPGQWNVYEVWCVGDTVRPYVNGRLMNEATGCAITEGKICLQSEGVPVEFRNVYLEPATPKPWPVVPTERIGLFNGKDLEGWVRFSPDDQPDDDGQWTVDKVWSVRDGVIHSTGVPNGYIRTIESYADYKLHLEWRWIDKPTNSGVLLHKAGIDRVWPTCVEAQLMHENAGDFWLLSHSTIVVDGEQVGPGPFVNAKKKHPSNEKPVGEWNTYDVVCEGGRVHLTVNGLVQNEGVDANPASGPICLQSEGSPIEFRNVYLEPLDK